MRLDPEKLKRVLAMAQDNLDYGQTDEADCMAVDHVEAWLQKRESKAKPVCFVSTALAAASGQLSLDAFAKTQSAMRPKRSKPKRRGKS